jgi:hypothetical protein
MNGATAAAVASRAVLRDREAPLRSRTQRMQIRRSRLLPNHRLRPRAADRAGGRRSGWPPSDRRRRRYVEPRFRSPPRKLARRRPELIPAERARWRIALRHSLRRLLLLPKRGRRVLAGPALRPAASGLQVVAPGPSGRSLRMGPPRQPVLPRPATGTRCPPALQADASRRAMSASCLKVHGRGCLRSLVPWRLRRRKSCEALRGILQRRGS